MLLGSVSWVQHNFGCIDGEPTRQLNTNYEPFYVVSHLAFLPLRPLPSKSASDKNGVLFS